MPDSEHPGPPGKNNSDSGIWSILSKIAGVSALIGAYLTFTGWVYFATFFGSFGVSFRLLDPSAAELGAYAFRVISSSTGLWVIATFASVTGAALWIFARQKTFIVLVALAILYPVLYSLSARQADLDGNNISADGRGIYLHFKDPLKESSAETDHLAASCDGLIKKNNGGDLKSLTQTKDAVIVFYACPDSRKILMRHVMIVPRADLAYTEEILP